jgi:plasmid stabilization system protein ParE
MNEVFYTEQALTDLERLSDFLLGSDPAAAQATVGLIFEALDILTHSPEIGRKIRGGNRELVISRGSSGYLALYRFLAAQQRVLVLAVRHQRESGYKNADF